MQRILSTFFQGEVVEDALTRRIKAALENALSNFEAATKIEFATKVPAPLFNNIDQLIFDQKDILHMNEIHEAINNQRGKEGVLSFAQKLLNSNDIVLRFCVAVELAEKFDIPVMLDMKNKSLKELRDMANQDGGNLVAAVREKVAAEMREGLQIKNR
jgi:hypothetical protein